MLLQRISATEEASDALAAAERVERQGHAGLPAVSIQTVRQPSTPGRDLTAAVVSPRLLARIAGAYYLIALIAAPRSAATATPSRMLLTLACDVAVALIFYVLFKPVSRRISLAALVFRLIFVAMVTFASLQYFGVLGFLPGAHSAQVFDTAAAFCRVPLGIHCLLIGYLIFRSEFLPRFIAVLLALAGLADLTFVSPAFVQHFYPYILIPGAVGAGVLIVWLLIHGIDGKRWPVSGGST